VGTGLQNLAYSSDGLTWTGGTGPQLNFNTVAWNGSQWLAAGIWDNLINRGAAVSSDGITWTGITGPFSVSGAVTNGLTWINTRWVAVGSSPSLRTISTSTDGTSWTTQTGPFGGTGAGAQVAWNGYSVVAVGSGDNTVASSTDGLTWTGLGTNILSSGGSDVCWAGNKWVAGGFGSSGNVAYSYDKYGSSWVLGSISNIGTVRTVGSNSQAGTVVVPSQIIMGEDDTLGGQLRITEDVYQNMANSYSLTVAATPI